MNPGATTRPVASTSTRPRKGADESAAIVREGLAKVAVYRAPDGFCHRHSAVCPHLGALVRWNADAGTWDIQKVFAAFPRLAERHHHRGNELSGGEQQMLAIGRALVANPLLLAMDEPTEGLAPMLVAEVARLILRLKEQGTSILLVEQNAAFAVKLADYAHVMSKGQIVHSSEPAALWANQDIKTQLLGVPRAAGPGSG